VYLLVSATKQTMATLLLTSYIPKKNYVLKMMSYLVETLNVIGTIQLAIPEDPNLCRSSSFGTVISILFPSLLGKWEII